MFREEKQDKLQLVQSSAKFVSVETERLAYTHRWGGLLGIPCTLNSYNSAWTK